VAAIPAEQLIFLDESGVNLAMTRRYARSPRGTRAHASAPINYGENVSVVGAVGLRGIVTAMAIDGAMDGEIFVAFVEQFLAPTLRPGDVVVMDNLGAHHVLGVRAGIEATGARLLYLPPYSPDFSPIELCWSKVKTWLKAKAARTRETLEYAIADALDQVSIGDLTAWFKHCGYRAAPT
jgi:transposase